MYDIPLKAHLPICFSEIARAQAGGTNSQLKQTEKIFIPLEDQKKVQNLLSMYQVHLHVMKLCTFVVGVIIYHLLLKPNFCKK